MTDRERIQEWFARNEEAKGKTPKRARMIAASNMRVLDLRFNSGWEHRMIRAVERKLRRERVVRPVP